MATLEQLVSEHFADIDGITALHYIEAVKPSLPYMVFSRVSDPNAKEFLTVFGGQARMQFDIYTRDRYQLPEFIIELKRRARSFRGLRESYEIMSCVVANEFMRDAQADQLYRGVVDMIVEYQEVP